MALEPFNPRPAATATHHSCSAQSRTPSQNISFNIRSPFRMLADTEDESPDRPVNRTGRVHVSNTKSPFVTTVDFSANIIQTVSGRSGKWNYLFRSCSDFPISFASSQFTVAVRSCNFPFQRPFCGGGIIIPQRNAEFSFPTLCHNRETITGRNGGYKRSFIYLYRDLAEQNTSLWTSRLEGIRETINLSLAIDDAIAADNSASPTSFYSCRRINIPADLLPAVCLRGNAMRIL